MLHNIEPEWTASERDEADSLAAVLADGLSAAGLPVETLPVRDERLADALRRYDPRTHLVLNWCESVPGIPHSEALVARTLEDCGFVFTGASSETLESAWDKRWMKEQLERAGVPTPAWGIFVTPCADGWDRFPAIVKPVNEHCSEGISSDAVAVSPAQLESRIAFVLERYDQPALVEDFIDGREFHVALWGNGHIDMLPPVEMDFSRFSDVHDRLCTYEAKFVPGSRHYDGIETLLPAPLSESELAEMRRVCEAAYKAIGCRDYGRIDLRMRDGLLYVLDVNPNADISPDASLACAAEHAGYTYGETGARILRLAARRWMPA